MNASLPRIISGLLASALFVAPAGAAAGPGGGTAAPREAWKPPERVVGGNAVSALLPFQIGAVGYLPKAKIGFEYHRQFQKAHWGYLSASFLGDHGNFQNFRMKNCGFEDASGNLPAGLCDNGSVLGFDVGLGYIHKFYLSNKPWVVPFIRAGIGAGWWRFPSLKSTSERNQIRVSSFNLNVHPAFGMRWFLTGDFGIGAELQVPVGFSVHTDLPRNGDKDRNVGFLLGFAALLGLEYRF